MQSLEAACEEGERPIKKAKLNQTSLLLPRHQENNLLENAFNKQFCIHSRLQELYNVESAKNPDQISEGLKYNSYLLEKLVEQERLNTLVVNLYPGNKGYSLAFPSSPHSEMGCDFEEPTMLETLKWPYEENELLRYIDNEELPAFFIDVLEPDFNFLFYSGCIIAEVRDYRRAYPHFKKCDIHHVLLKPTLQSILADINLIMEQHVDWGSEEKLHLESQILLATNPSLCVESNPAVASIQAKVNHCRQLLNTHRLRRTARKFSQDTVNRKRKLDQFTHRPGLELFNYITRLRAKSKNALVASKHLAKKMPEDTFKPIPVPSLSAPNIAPPSQGVHINEFKAYQRPKETSDCSPQLIEEYVLETDMPSKEKGKSRVYHIKLSILQRPSNSEYLGELYLDRDHKKDERNGVACRFSLGSRAHANRYIQQFTEIFTEGGRKSVRIKYGLSPGLKERVALVQAQAAQLQAAQQAAQVNLAQQHLAQLNQNLQNNTCPMPLVNGTVTSGITLLQQTPTVHNASSVSLLHSQMQPSQSKQQLTSQEAEINALATKLMNSAQQYQEASANAKQQKLAMSGSTSSNAAIINLLNSSPASNVNSDASAAVVNAINSGPILPQQVQTINQKLIGRKMTLSSLPNARVLNHTNLIAVNNSRMSLSDLNTSVPSSSAINFGQTVPIKQVISQRSPSSSSSSSSGNSSDKSALSALLVGTPAADRPDIINPNSNSLLLEKLASASKVNMNLNPSPSASSILSPKATAYSDLSKDYAGEIYVDMDKMSDKTKSSFIKSSPKSNPVISPLSSPPPPSPVAAAASSTQTQNLNTINVQSLNLASLQNLSGLQNVQVQLSGFSQPISLSLNVSSAAGIQGHPASIIVSLPVATTGGYAGTSSIPPQQVTAGTSLGTPTVVLTNAGTAQLVTSSIKPINQTNIRNATQTGVTLAQGTPQFQILTSVQRPKLQQTSSIQQNAATRNIQRTPFTIKMTTPNTTQVTMTSSPNSLSSQQLQLALQKQAQIQQFQQIYNQQQRSSPTNGAGKVRRRSNTSSDTQQ
ncbi:transcription factor SPT20 homolog isoform X2 [Agrilus planipennis]|uniref:Transcription factor SPT20 homolog isoform X2 n=1 Tax=Agrilus planipennis TaxID=224129 RepID=A0A7F5R3G1_AGRPL|nr:transcription factor SPT20 homolog isoform X2 [Agrilus planipennis]